MAIYIDVVKTLGARFSLPISLKKVLVVEFRAQVMDWTKGTPVGDLHAYNNIPFIKIIINILSKIPKPFMGPLYWPVMIHNHVIMINL